MLVQIAALRAFTMGRVEFGVARPPDTTRRGALKSAAPWTH
jgi:hypothetical protein